VDSEEPTTSSPVTALPPSSSSGLPPAPPYIPGDFVWARFARFPFWPAVITNPQSATVDEKMRKSAKPQQCLARFFGTYDFGWIPFSNIKEYHQFKDELEKLGKTKAFLRAVKEAEEYAQTGVLPGPFLATGPPISEEKKKGESDDSDNSDGEQDGVKKKEKKVPKTGAKEPKSPSGKKSESKIAKEKKDQDKDKDKDKEKDKRKEDEKSKYVPGVGRINITVSDTHAPLAAAPPVKVTYATKGEAIQAFKALLKDKGIGVDTKWNDVMPLIVSDMRYKALTTIDQRKNVLKEYQYETHQAKKEEAKMKEKVSRSQK